MIALFPLLNDSPEIVVCFEFFLCLRNGSVVTDVIVFNQVLTVVDLLGILVSLINPLLDVLRILSNLLVVFNIAEVFEVTSKCL
jgi:hypothetical protein